MRLGTDYLKQVQKHIYKRGEPGERILAAVIAHRGADGLDAKYPAGNPWANDDDKLKYEVEKLITVYGLVMAQDTLPERHDAVEALKKEFFPAKEVDEIVREYGLLEHTRAATRPSLNEHDLRWVMSMAARLH